MTDAPASPAAKKKRRVSGKTKKAQAVTGPPRRSRRIQALQKPSQSQTDTELPTEDTCQTDAREQLEKSQQPQQDQVSVIPPLPTRSIINQARLCYWVKNNTWPSADQEKEIVPGLAYWEPRMPPRMPLASRVAAQRIQSMIEAETSLEQNSGDDVPREKKHLKYRDPDYELELAELGYFMSPYTDISPECLTLGQKLVKSPQSAPKDTLFGDDLFKETMKLLHGRNEVRVIRDIARLIVPSAELLAARGSKHLNILRETNNAAWTRALPFYGPRPQPDYALGFKKEAFSAEQRRKLQVFDGGVNAPRRSHVAVRRDMYFPFLTSEVKCGNDSLDIADRQNAHSQAVQLRALFRLFRAVDRHQELHGTINGFSVSHSDQDLRIWAHLILVEDNEPEFRQVQLKRCAIGMSLFDDEDTRWVGWTVTMNILDLWVTDQFKLICSAVDMLPSHPRPPVTGLRHDTSASRGPVLSHAALSQPLEEGNLADEPGTKEQSVRHITPAAETQTESGPVRKKQKTKP